MSGLRDTGLVAGRELREALRRKTFWIVAALLVVGSTAGMILPEVVDQGRDSYDVVVVDGTPQLESSLSGASAVLDADVRLSTAPDAAAAQAAVKDGDADVGAVAGNEPVVIVKGEGAPELVAVVQQALGLDALTTRLEAAGVSPTAVQQVLTAPGPTVQRLDAGASDRRAGAAIVATALYLLLLMLMIQVANGTAIEKSNRISEVLLAIVRPGALLFGKVLGVGMVGLLTLACGILPVLVKLAAGGDLPSGLEGALAGGAAWFILGGALYLILAGAFGALVERQEEAGSAVMPLTMTLIGSFLVAQSAPDSALGAVLAYIPLTSPLVMPARIAMGVASPLSMAVSLVLSVVAVVVAVRVGSTVYQRAIVRTGRRLKLSAVLRGA